MQIQCYSYLKGIKKNTNGLLLVKVKNAKPQEVTKDRSFEKKYFYFFFSVVELWYHRVQEGSRLCPTHCSEQGLL